MNSIRLSYGIGLTFLFALFSYFLSMTSFISSFGLSPLVISILLGVVFANTYRHKLSDIFSSGINFSAKKILRLAIILYGFRVTMQEIAGVGITAIEIDLIVIFTTFFIAYFLGVKVFKLDKQTSVLIGAGASICGAAAVLATEGVLKSESYKSAIAVATVVLFGTAGMFLYPVLFDLGYLNLTHTQYGIYTGATIHEVAQVVVAGDAIGAVSAEYAVVVKMARVMMLAPFLIFIAMFFTQEKAKIQMPWFAIGFILVAIFNSFGLLPKNVVDTINFIDVFLLSMAMAALGIETTFDKLKKAGAKAFVLAFILFIWLVVSGYFLVKILT